MADCRIEISLDEYNSLKEQISGLEKTNSKLLDNLFEKNAENEELKSDLENLKRTPLLGRILHWKELISQ